MDFEKVFKLLIPEFQKAKIDFALVGGLALHFSGVIRNTYDIDMMVLLAQSNEIDEIMKRTGFDLLHKTQNVANYYSENKGLGQIDFLFAHRKYGLEMLKRAESVNIFSFKAKVLKSEDIIGLKVQSCANDPLRYLKDMADIEELMVINKNSLNLKLVQEYFKLFNREEEFFSLLKKIQC